MEYAGYTPTDNLDIAGLTSKLSESIYGIGTQKQARRAELDKAKSDAEELINSQEMTDSQSFNTLILKGSNNARDLINKKYKELKSGVIKPSEFKEFTNNLSKNWGTLANSAKTFDERYQEHIKRQQADENGYIPASAWEIEQAERFGKVAELASKDLVFNEKGGLYSVDATTGETWSIDALNKPENILCPRVDAPKAAQSIVKNIMANTTFTDLGRGGEKEVESTLLNHGTTIELGINSITSNPKNAVSLFTDLAGIPAKSYLNEKERDIFRQESINELSQAKMQAGQSGELTKEELDRIDLSLVKIDKDANGLIIPVLNPEQMKVAKDSFRSVIESQLYTKITGKAKQDWYHAPVNNDKGNGLNQKDILSGIELYKLTKNAFEQSNPGDNSQNNDYLRSAGQNAGVFLVKSKKPDNNGNYPIVAYKYVRNDATGKLTSDIDWKSGEAYYQGKSLASAITGKTPDEANTLWEIGNTYKDQIESTPLKKKSSFNANQEANIKATIKANPGATREDAIKVLGY